MARKGQRKLAGEVTPEQEAAANKAANEILDALRNAKTDAECAEIGQRTSKVFARLQEVHPVRAIHIVNLAGQKKREFEKARRKENQRQAELW